MVTLEDNDETVVSDVVGLSHHQLWVIDGEALFPAVPATRTNALVDVYEGAAVVATGIHTGVVTVTTVVRSRPPTEIDVDGWDEVVEVSVEMPDGDGRLCVLMADVPASFGSLTPAGPGSYRLLARARGRDINIDGVATEPLEHHHLTMWPAAAAPTVIHKETDSYGAGWHRYVADADPVRPPSRDEWDPSRHDQP